MGGPGANILLKTRLTSQQEDELLQWLHSNTTTLENGQFGYNFWLRPDALPPIVSDCQFFLSLDDSLHDWDEEIKMEVAAQLGYLPAQLIEISSGCNKPVDHFTLGQFVLHLAQTYHALIDMGGDITPPLKSLAAPWSHADPSLQEISAYVQSMPGTVYAIEYTVTEDRRWVFHIVDIPFFQSWLHNPHFHMIK